MLYVLVNNVQSCRDIFLSSKVEPVLRKGKIVLLKVTIQYTAPDESRTIAPSIPSLQIKTDPPALLDIFTGPRLLYQSRRKNALVHKG